MILSENWIVQKSKMFIKRIIACICLILFDSEATGKHWQNIALYIGLYIGLYMEL